MKAIFNRSRRLENAAAPVERERAAVEGTLEDRRRRLDADYKPIEFPPDWFAGCRSTAERVLRPRQFGVEQRANGARRCDGEPSENDFR
jgi:hypothetical protein